MQSFLSRVVSEVLLKEQPLINYVFVLPSQRACTFLKHELVVQLTKTSFLPQILSIENYIQQLAGINQIDSIQLLFEFYAVYKKNTAKNELDSFETFSQWATIVLQDFNEVDRHLIDSKDLFAYLKDINRLNNWTPTTELTKNYFKFFEKLHLYYNEFYKYLISIKAGYQGLIYREAENNIQHYIECNKDKHVVFVGFNALNKAEEHIFQEILQSGIGSIYWDADLSQMTSNSETGIFLRKYKKEWPYYQINPFNWVDNYLDEDKDINCVAATKNVGQLKYVGELLEKQDNFKNTALVLADESLLSLALCSLPNKVEKINITMGFSLSEIPLASFFNSVFNLYLSQEKLNLIEKNEFYYKDILTIVNHPSFFTISNNSRDYTSKIGRSNLIFLSYNNLINLFNNELKDEEIVTLLFNSKKIGVKSIIRLFIKIIELTKKRVTGIEKEQVFRFYKVFQQLENLNDKYDHIKSLKTLYRFYNQLVKNEKLSFQGEPLEGLQLMGMLETRAIDFETVIITSMNEGILPASKSDKSFIPFDVKKHFGLPTYQEKDAIFSYHFYRLLHRAKNIYLIYNTEKDAYGTGEKSRFLTQLSLRNKNIKQFIISQLVESGKEKLQIIPKTESLCQLLKGIATKGISPSSLATYINNPIDFYYQKILKIRDVDVVEETVAVNTMGTVIHETLEYLYKPYINKFLSEEIIKNMIASSEDMIVLNFKRIYVNGDISRGKNKLIFEVSKKYLERFLKLELLEIKNGKKIKIIALEQELFCDLKIDELDFPLKIRGVIDRVDEVDGVLRILDYKTGMVKATDLKMSDFSKMKEGYKYTKALQVMMYAYLYSKSNTINLSENIEAGIISFKNLNSGFLKMNFAEGKKTDNQITQDRIDEFMMELKAIIIEIFDKNIPFEENPDKAF